MAYDKVIVSSNRTVEIGEQRFAAVELSPDLSGHPDFNAVVETLRRLLADDLVVLMPGVIEDYGAPAYIYNQTFAAMLGGADLDGTRPHELFPFDDFDEALAMVAPYGGDEDWVKRGFTMKYMRSLSLAATVTDCIVIGAGSRVILDVFRVRAPGYVIARPFTGLAIAQALEIDLERHVHGRSIEFNPEDLLAHSNLWAERLSAERLGEAAEASPSRAEYVTELAATLARQHQRGTLSDVNEGNYLLDGDTGTVKLVDMGGVTHLLRPAAPAERARDIAPLFREFTAEDWGWFRHAYRREFPESPVCTWTINLIETGEERRWEWHIDAQEFLAAYAHLRDAIETDGPDGRELCKLKSNLAYCCSRLRLEGQAFQYYAEALDLTDEPVDRAVIQFNVGVNLNRFGHYADCLTTMTALLDSPVLDLLPERLIEEINSYIRHCKGELDTI